MLPHVPQEAISMQPGMTHEGLRPPTQLLPPFVPSQVRLVLPHNMKQIWC